VDVRFIAGSTVETHPVAALPELLQREDGITWVDIPECGNEAVQVLSEVFGFHPLAVRSCTERNRVPKVHGYPDHFYFVLHAPELGQAGHVHYVELDQFVGTNFLVTVHGPLNPLVDPAVAVRQTESVLHRIEAGRLKPATPADLSYAIVSALNRHMEAFVEQLTETVWHLEQRVTAGHLSDPEQVLEEMFRTRHGLLAVGTMGAASREVYKRMVSLSRVVPAESRRHMEDAIDQFDRVSALANVQRDYLQGVIDFYRARTDTKMTIAAERLAVVAVVTLPVTALASVYGMNIIVNGSTDVPHLVAVLVVMLVMSGALLAWAKRQGWF
jgi:magnesium transporter